MAKNIWIAASDGELSVVQQYINSGNFTSNSKDPNGYTPIHAASSYGHLELLRFLISNGGDINIQDNDGETPLHYAEDVDTVKALIEEFKADYTIKNNEGQTVLKYMEEEDEYPEIIKYLKGLGYEKIVDDLKQKQESNGNSINDLISDLSLPSSSEQIHYTFQNESSMGEFDPEQKKRVEKILNSENPEEGLQRFLQGAFNQQLNQSQEETSIAKKRRED